MFRLITILFVFLSIVSMSLASTVKGKQATVLSIKNEPSTSIMVRKNSDKWNDFTAVGTIATAPQICNVFSHPFFSAPKENYDILDAMNGYFIWDGIEASTLWIEKQFKEVNAKLYGLGLDENTLIIADKNLTTCLKQIKMDRPNFIPFIKERFLPYLKEKCLVQNFSVKKKVDNKGKITEERIPLKKISCIDFNYNSRDYSYWNSTTFAFMLFWKEAYTVLSTIFDTGYETMNACFLERKKRLEQERLEKERLAEERKKAECQRKSGSWNLKSILEKLRGSNDCSK